MLRFLDAGESHGRGMVAILEGAPYGVPIGSAQIGSELARRRIGYGRSGRMAIEGDKVEIISGVRGGITMGSPIAIMVENAEHREWAEIMSAGEPHLRQLTRLRPGHADLAGAIKYGTQDVRDILERASARETVGRVCVGAVARALLRELQIEVYSHVVSIGGVTSRIGDPPSIAALKKADENPLRCLDDQASKEMMKEIDKARDDGDSLGGRLEIVAFGVPIGLGSHVHWDRKLDARIAMGVMSIQGIKGVEIGEGFSLSGKRGSEAADIIGYRRGKGFRHASNNAGGVEGGITNGEPIVVRAAMKPIPTLASPLESVDLISKKRTRAAVERADVCAVPAAAVIAESVICFVLADALIEKLGGDSLAEIKGRYQDLRRAQRDL
jgi:chorismate synthase